MYVCCQCDLSGQIVAAQQQMSLRDQWAGGVREGIFGGRHNSMLLQAGLRASFSLGS